MVEGRQSSPVRVDRNNLQFEINEADVGVDLNGDGDVIDPFNVVPLIWHKAFKTGPNVKATFLVDFVQGAPKHAFDFFQGGDLSWEDSENFDPDNLGNSPTAGSSRLTAPVGVGTGDNKINVSIGQFPVWVIGVFRGNRGIEVQTLLPPGRY